MVLNGTGFALFVSPTKQAMFTEPADQSVWWYHHFLLTWAEEDAASSDMDRYENFLRAEAATLEELIDVEGRCKVCLALLNGCKCLSSRQLTPPLKESPPTSPSLLSPLRFSPLCLQPAFLSHSHLCARGTYYLQWAELALLLVSQRLANSLDPPQRPSVEKVGGSGEATTGGGADEAAKVRTSCRSMAARLSELDPMHGRFYHFVERGGSVFGEQMRGAAGKT